ncbi:uncharacterized protein LOC128236402 [Mya arenaria]|nr:uncharacterized protein LOC128236402 [Mya arenaria]
MPEMTFQRQRANDPAIAAFLVNQRHQKDLTSRLVEIDRLMYARLKSLSRDRLDVSSDLCRLDEDMKRLEYYDKTMDGVKMRDYNDHVYQNTRDVKKQIANDNFTFDSSVMIKRKISAQINLPKVNSPFLVTQKYDTNVKKPMRKRTKHRRDSTLALLKSKSFSVSDSNLHRVSSFAKQQSILNDEAKVRSVSHEDLSKRPSDNTMDLFKRFINRSKTTIGVAPVLNPGLPSLGPRQGTQYSLTGAAEERRPLKAHMAASGLPTVRESTASRQRKLSV